MQNGATTFVNNSTIENNNHDKTKIMGYNADFEDSYHEQDLKRFNFEDDYQDTSTLAPISAPSIACTMDPTESHDTGWMGQWSTEAMKLMQKGELYKALHYLSLCLDETFRAHVVAQGLASANSSGDPESQGRVEFCVDMLKDPKLTLSIADELNLLEKRCLVLMKLRMFDRVWEDSRRILEKKPNHALALKCLLAALCKMNKLDQVPEVIKLWKKTSPNDLDMLECRTKLEGLMNAVTNGIDPKQAFSNVEELLGLSYDWLLGRKILDDSQWRYRPLPPGENSFVLCLQYRFGHCSLGEKCPDAHGEQELAEWKNRLTYSLSNMTVLLDKIKLDSGASYVKSIMDALSGLEDERSILSEELPGSVLVSCLEPLRIQIQSSGMDTYTWKFNVESKRLLTHVCLLHELHRPYFHIASAFFQGTSNKVNLLTGKCGGTSLQVLDINVSPTAMALTGPNTSTFSYSIEITFTPEVFGMFRQTVVFDFNSNPKLVRHMSAEVVPSTENDSSGNLTNFENTKSSSPRNGLLGNSIKSRGTWHFGNADIVDSLTGERVPSTKVGFALMNGNNTTNSLASKIGFPSCTKDLTLTKENYKERMRFFLTQEERARQEILSKYNVSAHLTMLGKYDMKGGYNDGMTRYAVSGALFARMTLFRDVSEDTAVGRLILRSCNCILLTKSDEALKCHESGKRPRVYLCCITDKTKNAMYIDVGHSCVQELGLKESDVASFDIQFQLDRSAFVQQKNVIDQINETHLNLLFPSFDREMCIPWSPLMQWNSSVETDKFRLNPKQKEALIAVTAEAAITPPILIIGPFGTGKTFTLAQCIKMILAQRDTRVIICTHSNSAADLYIKEYLHPMVEEGNEVVRPLRIYYEQRSLKTVHPTILQYCIVENGIFRNPTREEVLHNKVIVVTLSTSYALMDLDLPSDCFSHIILDEAAQAMESEAITPLMVAGERTRLVLAGDHMQLSPELFSEHAKNYHSSLLERLHHSYPDNHPCKLMLCENYRSHSAIIQFASESFYQKKLECGISQPVHSKFYPLTFFVARGEDIQEADSTSYYNMAEVCEIADKVAELISSWPASWGNWRHENSIGVLTPYPDQVVQIRARLRQRGLYNVSVERVLNVQGKQFRAVFLSTVRTHKPWVQILPTAVGNEVDLGFFSNPKLLNTALTRAQSLVAVVGDPVSLCSLGKCRRLWEDFIQICNDNKSLFGISFSQLKQNILGVELRLTWGLNPLANEFEPQQQNFFRKPRSKFAQLVSCQLESQESAIQNQTHQSVGQQTNTLAHTHHHTMAANPTLYNRKVGDGLFNNPPALLGNPPNFREPLTMIPNPTIPGIGGMGIQGSFQFRAHPPLLQQSAMVNMRKASPVIGRLDRAFSNPSLSGSAYNPAFNVPIHPMGLPSINPGLATALQTTYMPTLPPGTPPYQPNLYASGLPLMHVNHPGAGGYLVPLNQLHSMGNQRHSLQHQQHSLSHSHSSSSAFIPYMASNQLSNTSHQQPSHSQQTATLKVVPRPFMASPGSFPPLGTTSVESHTPSISVPGQILQPRLGASPWRATYRVGTKVSESVPASMNLVGQTGLPEYTSGGPIYRPLQQTNPYLIEQHQLHANASQQQAQFKPHQPLQQSVCPQQQSGLLGRPSIPFTPDNFPGGRVFSPEEILYMKRVLEHYSSTNPAAGPQLQQQQPLHEQRINSISQEMRVISSAPTLNMSNLHQGTVHQQNPIHPNVPPNYIASGNYQLSGMNSVMTNKLPTWNENGENGYKQNHDFQYVNSNASASAGIWNGSAVVSTPASCRFIRDTFGNSNSSPGAAGRSYASAVKQQQQQQQVTPPMNKAVGSTQGLQLLSHTIKKPTALLLSDGIPPLFPDGVKFNKPIQPVAGAGGSIPKKGRKRNTKKE